MVRVRCDMTGARALSGGQCALVCLVALFLLVEPAPAEVCSSVGLQLSQDATMERQAFTARLGIDNGLPALPVMQLSVAILVADQNGYPVTVSDNPDDPDATFFLAAPTLSGVASVGGDGVIPADGHFADGGDGCGVLTWQPDSAQRGTYQVKVTATDGELAATETLRITVLGEDLERSQGAMFLLRQSTGLSRLLAMPRRASEPSRVTDGVWVEPLQTWYRENCRDLPWRRRRTAYAIWVSEIMLQQTQVDTVMPYYRRFMRQFPSVRKLAQADLQDVLKLWEGLGYYARARNLHRAAAMISEEYRGRMPRTHDKLLKLPGIGDYTAAAISSISFGEPRPVVDGNVLRVFCRFWGIADDIRLPAVKRVLADRLQHVIPHDAAGDFNQAIMEIGALTCRLASPACEECPLRTWCHARAEGRQSELPYKSRRAPVPEYRIAVGITRRNGKILLARRRADGMLGGLWEFPGGKRRKGEALRDTVSRETREETGIEIDVGRKLCTVHHAYSHFKIVLDAYLCSYRSGRARALESDDVRWVLPGDLQKFPFPTANKKILAALLRQDR